MAEAFPHSRFTGYDFSGEAIAHRFSATSPQAPVLLTTQSFSAAIQQKTPLPPLNDSLFRSKNKTDKI